MNTTDNPSMVQASLTTLRIVEALKRRDGAGVTELADHLDIPKSTVHNHLQTLKECEFVVHENGTYRIGLRFLDFGQFVWERVELVQAARNEADRLAEETGDLAHVMVEEHGLGVFVYQTGGDRAVNTNLHVGKRVHLHQTGLGKAILAYLPDDERDEILDQHGLRRRSEETIVDRDVLLDELEETRRRGYAVEDEEWIRGLRSVAAPVRDKNGYPIGSLSLTGPLSRMRGERYEETIPDRVQSAANVIELNVEYDENF